MAGSISGRKNPAPTGSGFESGKKLALKPARTTPTKK
jgi:hypothetical protein